MREKSLPGFYMLPSGSIKDRKSTRLNSSHEWISYAVFCLKKKTHRDLRHSDREADVLAADHLRDAAPAMPRGPAPPLAAQQAVRRAAAQHLRDRPGPPQHH